MTRHDLSPATAPVRLDNNEGGRLSPQRVNELLANPPSVLREYPNAREIEQRIAERFNVAPTRVIVTAGADDAIDRCFRVFLTTGRSLILTAPTFQQFHRFAAATPAVVREVVWNEQFPVAEVLRTIDDTTGVVAFATPNNPTGLVAPRSAVEEIANALPNGIVLLDHAYVEYAGKDQDFTAFAMQMPNVIVVRTFSKAWGLAGCRVGYAIAPEAKVGALRSVGNPYPVSGPSIAVVTRRLEGGAAEVEDHIVRVRNEREALQAALRAWGIPVSQSCANFVFAIFGDRVAFVQAGLAARNIRVRAFPDRPELANGLRISLPDDTASFAYLLESLRVILDPDALLFDMDGVLADVAGSYQRCIKETAAHFGATISDDDIDAVLFDGDASNDWLVVQRLLAHRGRTVSLERIRTHFQMLYDGTPGCDGYAQDEKPFISPEALSDLTRGKKIAIVTGRPRTEAVEFLERFGLHTAVSVLVTMEDGPGKPNPAPVHSALAQLGVSTAWLMGDSPDDMVAAAGAGVLPIGIAPTDATARRRALGRAGAAVVVPDVLSLRSFLP